MEPRLKVGEKRDFRDCAVGGGWGYEFCIVKGGGGGGGGSGS